MNENLPKSLKRSLRDLVINVPLLSDYFLYHWVFPRSSASCRGVFSTFADASNSIPKNISGYDKCYEKSEFYDVSVEKNIENIELINQLNKPLDYPVLVWLREAFTDSSTVFDLGGNVGFGYYAYQKFVPYPPTLKWTVCDLPRVVEAGRQILEKIHSPGLSYTDNLQDAEGAEIFITCGTLQYLEMPLAKYIEQLSNKPRHLIIHHVPFYEGDEYFTLQNLIPAHAPYKVQNCNEFLASLNHLGYKLVDSWEINRTCRIPFHSNLFVRAYYGFYLRKNN